jgi:hypothetical protein
MSTEKKLTAMQIHISDLYKMKEFVISKKADKDLEETILVTIDGCIENATAYVEKEKQNIINAWNHAETRKPEEMKHINNAKDYYNKTFKN